LENGEKCSIQLSKNQKVVISNAKLLLLVSLTIALRALISKTLKIIIKSNNKKTISVGGVLDFSIKYACFPNFPLGVRPTFLSFLSHCSLEPNCGTILVFRAFHPLPIFPSSILRTKHKGNKGERENFVIFIFV